MAMAAKPSHGGRVHCRRNFQRFFQATVREVLNHLHDKEQVIPTIDADQAHALLSSGHGYIDVRMREDFDKGHAPGSRNVPYYLSVTPQGKEKNPQFEEEVASLFGKDDVFIVGCNTGNRSRFATADLLNAGFKNARNLQGGYRSFLQSANQQPAQQQ